MDPSPIPKFDNPKLTMAAIQLFGAGREQRIYALPPYTRVVSLNFEDFPFEASKADHACDLWPGQLSSDSEWVLYATRADGLQNTVTMAEPARRKLSRTDWAFVHQNARDGLRMNVSAGGNVGERLMSVGACHYGAIRSEALEWLERVEIDQTRIDDRPTTFSGGMQQRLQIARNLVTRPRLIFMDEPTGGLDVSVQARLLDLLRGLVREMGLSAILVTHDLAVVRLLADQLMVMKDGHVVETGLTDQVLDDPQHGYSQLLVSSVLQV